MGNLTTPTPTPTPGAGLAGGPEGVEFVGKQIHFLFFFFFEEKDSLTLIKFQNEDTQL